MLTPRQHALTVTWLLRTCVRPVATLALLGLLALGAGCGNDDGSKDDRASDSDRSSDASPSGSEENVSPGDRYLTALAALEGGDCEGFSQVFLEEVRAEHAADCAESAGLVVSAEGSVLDTQIDGDTAIVTVEVTLTTVAGGGTDQETLAMTQIDGEWFVAETTAGVDITDGSSSQITPATAEVGQCFTYNDDPTIYDAASCESSHDGEIVGVVEIDETNLADVNERQADYCLSLIATDSLSGIVGNPDLEVGAFTENPTDMQIGDHMVCFVAGDDLTGSVL